jgi:hypothetical protein
MPNKRIDYQSAVRVLVNAGDITTFTQILQPRLAGVSAVAASAGISPVRMATIRKTGLNFSAEEITNMAVHFGITVKQMRALIENDPLYKKEEPKKKKGNE